MTAPPAMPDDLDLDPVAVAIAVELAVLAVDLHEQAVDG